MNFKFTNRGEISDAFISLGISDFRSACKYISKLPYDQKTNISCVLNELRGTCSTKHATLRKLALEQKQDEVKLILGIFKMDSIYAPKISHTLVKHQLDYIPEAHNYLRFGEEYIDVTLPDSNYSDFSDKLIHEIEIEHDQIAAQKIQLHQEYLNNWIIDKPHLTLNTIWNIREQCIHDLQS